MNLNAVAIEVVEPTIGVRPLSPARSAVEPKEAMSGSPIQCGRQSRRETQPPAATAEPGHTTREIQ
jgi:hypothetical protein